MGPAIAKLKHGLSNTVSRRLLLITRAFGRHGPRNEQGGFPFVEGGEPLSKVAMAPQGLLRQHCQQRFQNPSSWIPDSAGYPVLGFADCNGRTSKQGHWTGARPAIPPWASESRLRVMHTDANGHWQWCKSWWQIRTLSETCSVQIMLAVERRQGRKASA